MYGKNPHQRVRLNLKTQLGPGPRGGPVFSQQRFHVDNPPPPWWSSPMLQRQPNCRNNIPESIGSSNNTLPFNVKNQAFFRNSPPITNNSSDLSLNNKNFVSKNSSIEFTKCENSWDRQSFSPSDFSSKIVNMKSSSISRSNFLDFKQTSDSPLNSLHEALGFARNVSVNNESSAQSPHNNVVSSLERFNSPGKASRSVIPGLDEYADEDEVTTDEVNSNSSNIVNFNNTEWARHDSIPFLSELNKPSNIDNKDIKYSSQSAMDDYIDELRLEDHKFQEQNLVKNISPENICDELNSKGCKIETPAKSNSSISKSALEQALEILSTKEAVVGLDYIVEYQNNSSSASLSFSCTLCNSAISRQSIVDHILGGKHRMRYLKIKDEKKHQQILALNVETEMKEFAISKASFELEKIFGRGTVKVELKHKDISSPAANIEENYFSCHSDKVLSFHDIPIVSDNLSFGDKDERINEFSYDTEESNSQYDVSHKRKADSPVFIPKDKGLPIAEAAALSMYCPIIKNEHDGSSEHEVVDVDEHIPGCVEKLRFAEEISDTYTVEECSKKFLRSSPVLKVSPCKQEESNISQFYQYGRNKSSLSPLFSSSGSQPFMSQETARSIRKILVEDTRVKRSSSAFMIEEENARKFMKTDIKSEDNASDVFHSESVPRKVLKNDVIYSSELSMHGSSLINTNYDSKLHSSKIVGEELEESFKSKNDVSCESGASMLNLEALNASTETPMKLNNISISTKEICRSDAKLEENINFESTILQNLLKCAISTEEEAATVQQAITVLTEIFLKYKLQHLPKDRVELFIKSLHAGQTEDIPKIFQGLKTNEKSFSSEEVYSKEEPEKSVIEHCRTSHVKEVQFSEKNSSYVMQDTSNTSSAGVIDYQKPNCLAENNSNMYHSLNTDKSLQLQQHSNASIIMEAAMNIDKGVDNSRCTKPIGTVAPATMGSASLSLNLAHQTASRESLKPPPFFARPSTSHSQTNQPPEPPPVPTSSPDQTPHRERPPENNWNMSFQTPMHYNNMTYFPMPSVMPHQYHGMPHHQQSYPFPQMYAQSNQHGMYPNMGQHMNQPPLPVGTEMALANPPPPPPPPPEVRPPLPMQILSALAVPQPPPPPFPPPPMM